MEAFLPTFRSTARGARAVWLCALFASVSAGARAQPADDEPLVSAEDMTEAPAAASDDDAPAATGAKVLVLPYQPIYRSAEPNKVKTATDLVVKELGRGGNLVVIRGGVAKEGASTPAADAIEKVLGDARAKMAAKNVRAAIQGFEASLAEIEKSPAALEDAQLYVRVYHELARAHLQAGDDGRAQKVMDAAARMAPGYELPAKEFSRFYRKMFGQVAQKAIKAKPAEILVRTALPGAKIFLDGRETMVAPVRLMAALPGKHLVQAEVEGVPRAASVLTLKPGKNPEYTVSFGDTWGGVAVGAVADAIAENKLSAQAIKKAAEAGKSAEAAYVVAGGMAHDKVAARFNVHTFVVNVATGGVMQLDVQNFDLDMLTAESDVIRVVRGVERAVKDFKAAEGAVASIEGKVQPQDVVNSFEAKPDFSASSRKRRVNKRKPATRRPIKVRKGTGSIRIKDESD